MNQELTAPPSDYAHARHAGNSGDVFKHVALAALLRAVPEVQLYVESHAGDGVFTLGSVGEWTGGVLKLWPEAGAAEAQSADPIDRWLAAVKGVSRGGALPDESRPGRYPGSPLLARALLPAAARMILHELQETPARVLRKALGEGAQPLQNEIREADGFAALAGALAEAQGAPAVALIDPPFSQKGEWEQAAHALAAARAAAPQAALLLWYPIKALTRPRGLLAALPRLGLHGTAVELLTTPLRLKRDRLAGSGVVFVNAPVQAVRELCGALPRLGPPLATHGEWSGAQIGF